MTAVDWFAQAEVAEPAQLYSREGVAATCAWVWAVSEQAE